MTTAKTNKKSTLTLPSDLEIVTTRDFNAPPALIFKAHTDPALVAQWWGLRSHDTTVATLDLRVGGQWRFVQRAPNGDEYAFRGEYREIHPPTRLVNTFEWEGMPGHIVIDTMVLEEIAPGKTRMTTTSLFPTKEDRDGMMSMGMEEGANEGWDQLDELLAEKQQA